MNTKALFNIGYGLYVITAKEGDKDNGCISNTVIQVTSEPLQVAITLNKQNYTTGMISRTKKANISILSEEAKFDMFKRFGFVSGKDTNKFADYSNVQRSPNGVLYITESTNSYMSVYIQKEIDLGTHIMFIGQLVASEVLSNIPTATYTFYHNNIKPKPQTTVKKGWRCKICGYIHEGEDLPIDFVCPVCKHGASDFERIES